MIQHLNQFGFYKYGIREPDRDPEDIRRKAKLTQQVTLDWEKQTVYQAVSDTRILPGTILKGETVIGEGCVIGPDTVIEDSVIGDGVHLAPGAIVKAENRIASGSKIDSGMVIENRQYPL